MRTRHGRFLLAAALLVMGGPCGAAVTISLTLPADPSNPPPEYNLAALIARTLLGDQGVQQTQGNQLVFEAPRWSPSLDAADRSQLIDRLKTTWEQGVVIEDGAAPPARETAAPPASDHWAHLDDAILASVSQPNFDGAAALSALSVPEPAAPLAANAVLSLSKPQEPLAAYQGALQQASAESGAPAGDLQALILTKERFYRRLDPGNLIGLFDRPSAHKAAQALGLDDGPRETGLTALIKDPTTNVRLGAWLWAGLLQRFNGDKNRALMAWYTGRDDYRRERRDPEAVAVLSVFHGYLEGRGSPAVPEPPTPLPRPSVPPPQAVTRNPPPAAPGRPPVPQGRYWSVQDVEAWLSYLNVRDGHGFDADFLTFVKTIVFTESPHWDHGVLEADILARSPTNARGIMQFTKHTGWLYGLYQRSYVSGGRRYYEDDRLDPVKSLAAGMNYLDDLARINGRSRYPRMLREIARDYKGGDYWGTVREYYCRFGGVAVCAGRSG